MQPDIKPPVLIQHHGCGPRSMARSRCRKLKQGRKAHLGLGDAPQWCGQPGRLMNNAAGLAFLSEEALGWRYPQSPAAWTLGRSVSPHPACRRGRRGQRGRRIAAAMTA